MQYVIFMSIILFLCCAHRVDKCNEQDRLSSLIGKWINHDLECSWDKLATAVGRIRREHAGPGVAKRLRQSIEPGSGTLYVPLYMYIWIVLIIRLFKCKFSRSV